MTSYVVILVIMVLRYAPRSYLVGLGIDTEDEEPIDGPDGVGKHESMVEEVTGDWKAEEQPLRNEESLIRVPSISEIDEKDFQEDEEMDKVSSMRHVSSRGLLEDPGNTSPFKQQRSNRMLKSRSTGSLRASLRAQVPTFGE